MHTMPQPSFEMVPQRTMPEPDISISPPFPVPIHRRAITAPPVVLQNIYSPHPSLTSYSVNNGVSSPHSPSHSQYPSGASTTPYTPQEDGWRPDYGPDHERHTPPTSAPLSGTVSLRAPEEEYAFGGDERSGRQETASCWTNLRRKCCCCVVM